MIRIDNVSKAFGGLQAVRGVSFEVTQGSITGLIGAVLIGISLVWSLRYNRKHGRQTDTV